MTSLVTLENKKLETIAEYKNGNISDASIRASLHLCLTKCVCCGNDGNAQQERCKNK